MRCPDCDEPLNDLWVCEFCQVDYEPSQELKDKVIREFLEKKYSTEKLNDYMRHRVETWLMELEGEE